VVRTLSLALAALTSARLARCSASLASLAACFSCSSISLQLGPCFASSAASFFALAKAYRCLICECAATHNREAHFRRPNLETETKPAAPPPPTRAHLGTDLGLGFVRVLLVFA